MARQLVALACLLGVLACGDSFSPSTSTVAGTYAASELWSTTGGIRTNRIAGGAILTITLAPNGTTTGRLFVPGGNENGSDLDVSMAGTWTLSGDQVTFTQGADTFVRDMSLTATEDQLAGDETFSSTRIEVTLHRSGT
jgi:hypothetical protein